MARSWIWAVALVLVTTALTLATIWNPEVVAFAWLGGVGLFALGRLRDWWRRALVVSLLASYARASNLEQLADFWAIFQYGGVLVLLIATVLTTQSGHPYRNSLHKASLRTLWLVVAFAGASLVWSQSRLATLASALTLLCFVFILHRVSTHRWQDAGVISGDFKTIFWTSMVTLGAGLTASILGLENMVLEGGRHQWLFYNPNMLGIMAAVTLTIGIGLALKLRSPLYWFSLAIPVAGILLSQSRTALLAAGVAVIWISIRQGRKAIIPLIACALIGYFALGGANVFDRFEDGSNDPLSGRTLVWSDSLETLIANPIGAGWDASATALSNAYNLGIAQSGLFEVHSSYLKFIVELGWMGLIPLACLIAVLIMVLVKAPSRGLNAGLVATTTIGLLVHATESVMFTLGQPYAWIFWMSLVAAPLATKPDQDEGTRRLLVARKRRQDSVPLVSVHN